MKKRSALLGLLSTCACLAAAPVPAQLAAERIGAGGRHTCAVTTAGAVQCWGSNSTGQLGDGTMTSRSTLQAVAGLANGAVSLALGDWHTCALMEWGGVKCWGNNFQGQLGNGGTTQSLVPVDVVGLGSGVKAIAAGATHTCAVTVAGAVLCWGQNLSGQVGDGSNATRRTPVPVPGLRSGVAAIGAGRNHSCAVMESGEGLCWGSNAFGQIGTPRTDSNSPRVVQGLETGTAAIVGGEYHSCALMRTGAAMCWGAGSLGQLGTGPDAPSQALPTLVPGLQSGVTALSAYRHHTCASTAAATKCWGWNGSGQLGDSTIATPGAPVAVAGLAEATSVAVGADHSCARVAAGAVRCWGNNYDGQLGDGTHTTRLEPVGVAGYAGALVTNLPGSYTGLFWNPSESGWGVHLTQRGPVIFAAWFAYDPNGQPRWYTASDCRFDAVDARICQGTVYETQGSGYIGAHFTPVVVNTTGVGQLQLTFDDRDRVRMRYTLGSVSREVNLVRQVARAQPVNADYTDLWWNPTESGWGLSIAHQPGTMFLAWFVYDASGRALWYFASDCRTASGSTGCAGVLYKARGPAQGAAFDPSQVTITAVGDVEVAFTDAMNGTIRYTFEGISGTKPLTRMLF